MFKIEFETGNAAFTDGNPADEIARILRVVAARVEGGQVWGAVIDLNGNKVGEFRAVSK